MHGTTVKITCFPSIFDVPSFIHIAGHFVVGMFAQSRDLCLSYILRRALRGRVVGLTPHAQTRSVTSHRNLFSTLFTFHTLYVVCVCGGPTCRVLVTREPVDVHLKGILSRTDKLTFLLHEVIVLWLYHPRRHHYWYCFIVWISYDFSKFSVLSVFFLSHRHPKLSITAICASVAVRTIFRA